jgi:hypothetical protein
MVVDEPEVVVEPEPEPSVRPLVPHGPEHLREEPNATGMTVGNEFPQYTALAPDHHHPTRSECTVDEAQTWLETMLGTMRDPTVMPVAFGSSRRRVASWLMRSVWPASTSGSVKRFDACHVAPDHHHPTRSECTVDEAQTWLETMLGTMRDQWPAQEWTVVADP